MLLLFHSFCVSLEWRCCDVCVNYTFLCCSFPLVILLATLWMIVLVVNRWIPLPCDPLLLIHVVVGYWDGCLPSLSSRSLCYNCSVSRSVSPFRSQTWQTPRRHIVAWPGERQIWCRHCPVPGMECSLGRGPRWPALVTRPAVQVFDGPSGITECPGRVIGLYHFLSQTQFCSLIVHLNIYSWS